MSNLGTDDTGRSGIDRRTLIKRAAATGAVAWTAPLILDSLASPAGAITGAPGCHSVQIAAGNCTTSATPTASTCAPTGWSTSSTAPCAAFAGGQNLNSTLCITASPACLTTTSPISFNIAAGCACTFSPAAGMAASNGSGANACTTGVLSNANKTITFTFTGNASAWTAFRLLVTCS